MDSHTWSRFKKIYFKVLILLTFIYLFVLFCAVKLSKHIRWAQQRGQDLLPPVNWCFCWFFLHCSIFPPLLWWHNRIWPSDRSFRSVAMVLVLPSVAWPRSGAVKGTPPEPWLPLTWTTALLPITSRTCPLLLVPSGRVRWTISAYLGN